MLATRRSSRFLVITALLVSLAAAAPAGAEPRKYEIDPNHLVVAFMVEHIGYMKVLGLFREAAGSFVFDEESGEISDVRIVVQTASVFSNQEDRDEHLRSDDFLDCENHPEMTFSAERARLEGREGKLEGNLTLLGVTRPLTLQVTWNKSAQSPIAEGPLRRKPYITGVSARGSFLRSEYGMEYAVDNGWVGDEVELIIELEARRQ